MKYEITQCVAVKVKVAANEEKKGAVPEIARLASEPTTMTRIASKPLG